MLPEKRADMEQYSTEELLAKKKGQRVIQLISGALALGYGGYMIGKMFAGSWEPTGVPGFPFILLMIPIILTGRTLSQINAELKRREESGQTS